MSLIRNRRRTLALAVICAATLMTIIDETLVTVAAPSIRRDLGFAADDLSWVVNAYLVGFGGLLLLAGRLGDLVGRGRVLLVGLVVFTVASAACGLAPSPAFLIAARAIQGAGGALATGVALGMVAALFSNEGERGRAMGTYAFVGAMGASAGVFLGGVITSTWGWRWAFWLNVPVGVLVLTLGARYVDRRRGPGLGRGVDWWGALLLVTGLMSLVGAIVVPSLVLGCLAAALLVGFVVRQAMAMHPILPLGVLRSRVLAVSSAAHALFVGAMFTFQFLVTLYLQQVLGYSPARAGLGILPIAAGIAVVAMLVTPRLMARWGTVTPLLVGLALIVLGLALLTRASADGDYWTDLLPSVALFAAGGGLTLPSMMTTAMSTAPAEHVGVASGLLNTAQQVGGAVGLASLSAVAAAVTSTSVRAGSSQHQALVQGYHVAWGAAAGLAAVAWLLVVTLVARRTSDRTSDAPTAGPEAQSELCIAGSS